MSFDFSIIKGWVSWPIQFFKEKVLQHLSEEDKQIALYATAFFSALTVFLVYKIWKKPVRVASTEKLKSVENKTHHAAQPVLKETVKPIEKEPVKPEDLDKIADLINIYSGDNLVTPRSKMEVVAVLDKPKEEITLAHSPKQTINNPPVDDKVAPQPKQDNVGTKVPSPKNKPTDPTQSKPVVEKEKEKEAPQDRVEVISSNDKSKEKAEAGAVKPEKVDANPTAAPMKEISFEGAKENEVLKKGKLTINNEVWEIEGEFKIESNSLVGKGKIKFPSGVFFEGEYDKGVLKNGTLTFTNPELVKKNFNIELQPNTPLFYDLEGNFTLKDFFLCGKGSVKYHKPYFHEAIHKGIFENGSFEGEGSYESVDLQEQGFYKNGMLTKGKSIEKGIYQEGAWSEDNKFTGRVIFPNGQVFEGLIDNKLRDGKGMQYFSGDILLVGEFKNGIFVEGKKITVGTVTEGKFNEQGELVKGTITKQDQVWDLELQEERLVGKKVDNEKEQMGIFNNENFGLIEGISLKKKKEEGEPYLFMGYFDLKDKLTFGYSRYTNGERMGDNEDGQNQSIYYSNGYTWFGSLMDNRYSVGAMRYPDGKIEMGNFDLESNCKGINYLPANKSLEVLGEGLKKETIHEEWDGVKWIVEGIFEENVLKFGIVAGEKRGWLGVYDNKRQLIAGFYDDFTEGTFSSDGNMESGKRVIDGNTLLGAFAYAKQKFIGKVTYANQIVEEGIFFQEDTKTLPILKFGGRKLASGVIEQGFFTNGVLTKACALTGFME